MDEIVPSTPNSEKADKSLNGRLVSWSLGAGMCALIPIPFLDDWAVKRVQAAAFSSIWSHHGHEPDPIVRLRVLNGAPKNRGCLGILLRIPIWAAKWLVLYPIKKILRKILFIFAIHDAVNIFSDSYHRGYLLDAALSSSAKPNNEADAIALHDAIKQVCREAESRPVIQLVQTVFKRGNKLLRREGMRLYRVIRKNRKAPNSDEQIEETVESEAETLNPLASELENRLLMEKGYFDDLAKQLLRILRAPQPNTSKSTPPPL